MHRRQKVGYRKGLRRALRGAEIIAQGSEEGVQGGCGMVDFT